MTITSSTTVTHVVLVINPSVPGARQLTAYNGSTNLETIGYSDLPSPHRNYAGTASFQELDRRHEEGDLTVYYWVGYHYYDEDFDDIPEWAQYWIRLNNPFGMTVTTTAGASGPSGNVGPHTEFWYKRASGDAPTVPSLTSFDNNVNTIETLMDGSGWENTIPSGTDTLYHTRITWSVTNGVASAQASEPDTDDIRWSTDNGDTYSTTEPTNSADIDSIQHYVAGYGWVTYILKEETINPYKRLGGSHWQNGSNGSTSYDQYISLPTDTALMEDNYKVGFVVRKRESWTDTHTIVYGGECEMNTNEIVLSYPEDLDGQDSNGQVGNSTYMMVMNKETGGFDHVGICDPNTLCSDYNSQHYATWKFVWLGYPKTTIAASAATADTQITLSSASGIAALDTLFVGNEQMRVTSVSGDVVTVIRGTNGTTAPFVQLAGTEVRARVNRDEVEYLVFTHRNGVSTITTVQLYRIEKRLGS